jgi:hypothetical protein
MIAVVRTSQTVLLIVLAILVGHRPHALRVSNTTAKRDGVVPLFQELQRRNRFDSVWFLDGANHILRKLNEEGYLGPPSPKVLEAFEDPMKEIAIPKAAERALEALKNLYSQPVP